LLSSLSVVNGFENHQLSQGWSPNLNIVQVLELCVVSHVSKVTAIELLGDHHFSLVMLLARESDVVLVIDLEAAH